MKNLLTIVFFTFFTALDVTFGANILFLSPHTSHSHTHFFFYIIKELAARGHTITHWNGLKPREEIVNVTQLYSAELHHFNSHHPIGFAANRRSELLLRMPEEMVRVCNICYQDSVFQRILNTREHFDLIVIESFMNECMLPLVEHFKAPFIYISGLPPSIVVLEATCSPMQFATCPVLGTPFSEEMNVFERMTNLFIGMFGIYFRNNFILPKIDAVAAQVWTNTTLPPVKQIENKVSLFIANTHPTTYHNYPRSAIVEAAGIHLVPPNPLPKDLASFVSGSGDAGFIVLSFGSIVRGDSMPEATRKIFISAFSRLPQRVVWKWENASDGMPDLPPNVRLCAWLPPMLDFMAYSNMRLVMTHGGLFTNQEAVWSGIPLIALPVFGDQPQYAARAQKEGYAFHLDWMTLTEDSLFNSIQEIINNPKYKKRALEVSQLMRDQIDNPLSRAVYWIEYVIRHRGAPHLKSNAFCEKSIIEREMLDVYLIISIFLLLLAYIPIRLTSRVGSNILKRLQRGYKIKMQ